MKQHEVRSGLPFWRGVGPPPIDCPPLLEDATCEVVVVGGGITGALVSALLIRAGISTILVDKGEVGAGSTAASTGLLQYEIDTPLVDLIRQRGEQEAVYAYRRGRDAIDELEDLTCNLDDRADFGRRSTLYIASACADMGDLWREYECRRHFGFGVEWLPHGLLAEFSGIDAPGAIYSSGDAEINPYRLTQALLRHSRKLGLIAYGNTNVHSSCETVTGVILRTSGGAVAANFAVFCTGYWSHHYLADKPGRLHSTYATVGEPVRSFSKWPDHCLIWETARPYFYARQTVDGRAMIGGEDTPFDGDHRDDELIESKTERLVTRFNRMFPDIPFVPDYCWAGTFGETQDGLPYIGRPGGHERTYYALGYGGNGITFSAIAARLITDLILRRPNADAAAFAFDR